MSETFMLRILEPYHTNTKKRLIKPPKVYVRDSGILHALLDISDLDSLLGHPIKGASWESIVIENIVAHAPNWRPCFYRTRSGVEIDLILEKGQEKIAIECKSSLSPAISKGFYQAIDDIGVTQAWVVAPIQDDYPLNETVWVRSLPSVLQYLDATR